MVNNINMRVFFNESSLKTNIDFETSTIQAVIIPQIQEQYPKINAQVNFSPAQIEAEVRLTPLNLDTKIIPGITGMSAYQLAVENGFEGTIEEWLANLHGVDIELRTTDDFLQWKRVNEDIWYDLLPMADFIVGPRGEQGRAVEFLVTEENIQWKYTDEEEWTNVITFEELKGDKGDMPDHQWDGTSLQFQNPDGTWGNLIDLTGERGLNWKDTYSSVATYSINDAVRYEGGSYICIAESLNNPPTDINYWALLAERGADGEGAGDMVASVYDPVNKQADAFNMGNMDETLTAKVMTNDERAKLEGIEAEANKYIHPTNHDPSIITQDLNNRFVSDAEKSAWDAKQDALVADTDYLTPTTAETTYEPKKGIGDNYVTDAEKVVLGNTSGINTGDQDLSGYAEKSNVLEKDNTTAYTPTLATHPATKGYVDENAGDEVTWGNISGTLANQTDLQSVLDGKENTFTKNTAFNKNFGSVAGTVCQGNDSRLSDARTPIAHVHNADDISEGVLSINRIPTGTTGTTVALGNHSHSEYLLLTGGSLTGTLTVATDLLLPNATGTDNTLNIGSDHMISQHINRLTLYTNRANTGGFQIRSHDDKSSFRTEFAVKSDGDSEFYGHVEAPNIMRGLKGNAFDYTGSNILDIPYNSVITTWAASNHTNLPPGEGGGRGQVIKLGSYNAAGALSHSLLLFVNSQTGRIQCNTFNSDLNAWTGWKAMAKISHGTGSPPSLEHDEIYLQY